MFLSGIPGRLCVFRPNGLISVWNTPNRCFLTCLNQVCTVPLLSLTPDKPGRKRHQQHMCSHSLIFWTIPVDRNATPAIRSTSLSMNSRDYHFFNLNYGQSRTQTLITNQQLSNFSTSSSRRENGFNFKFKGSSTRTSNVDPRLLYAVYLSGFIGVLLIGAIIKRDVIDRARNRFQGIEEIESPITKGRYKLYKYKDVVIPPFALQYIKDSSIENFEVREDDIWIVSYPRSGTTMLMEIIYLISTGLNFEQANKELLETRVPYLEYTQFGIKSIDAKPSPRIIKTHLPLRLLPKQIFEKEAKILYIARNPKDLLVSNYHFFKLLKPVTRFNGTIGEFFDSFIHDKVPYSPWWRHVKEFWAIQEQEKMLFLTYEDLIQDPINSIQRIGLFLGKALSKDEAQQIAHHCHFDRMKANVCTNYHHLVELGIYDKNESFIRKGMVGDWTNCLTEDMSQKVDKLVAMKFSGTGLRFKYQA